MNIRDSIFICKIIKLISIINKFYENSILFKILDKNLKFILKSFMIGKILKNLKKKDHNYYSYGSFIISSIFLFGSKLSKILKMIYKKIYMVYKKGFIYLFLNKYIKPLREINIFLECFFSFILGFMVFRIILEIVNYYNIINLSFYIFCSLICFILNSNNYIIKIIHGSFFKKILMWFVKDN